MESIIKRSCIYSCIIFSFTISNKVWAGSYPVVYSSMDGYFFAYDKYYDDNKKDEGYGFISSNSSKSLIENLKNICKKKGALWGVGVSKAFTCLDMKEQGEVYERHWLIRIKKPYNYSRQDGRPILFSTSHHEIPTWKSRESSPQERKEIKLFLTDNKKRYWQAISSIKKQEVHTIDLSHNKQIFIIPWRVEKDEFSVAVYSVIAMNEAGNIRVLGELDGSIHDYVDLNQDGVPELIVSEACDGLCEYAYSIFPELKTLIEISVH